MASFEVYANTAQSTDQNGGRLSAHFIADKVSFIAILLPGVWLLWHRLWIEFGVYALFAVFVFSLRSTDFSQATAAISFLPGIYLFLEGQNLIAAKYRRAGHELVDIVEAENLDTAELKWFKKLDKNQKDTQINKLSHSMPVIKKPLRKPEGDADFGLFAPE